MQSRVLNPILSKPFIGWLHPDLAPVHRGLNSLAQYLEQTRGAIPKNSELREYEEEALDWYERLPRYANGQVVVMPLIHPDLCDLLVEEVTQSETTWAPNDDEERDYQIPEIVLKRDIPTLYSSLRQFADTTLFTVMKLMWGKAPTRVESIQLAWYCPNGTQSTGWHLDEDSNMTAVVNLAPELFAGGGTDFRTGIRAYEHVPPPPKGHALIFNGMQTLHRGAPVETGDRYILVYWTTVGRE